MNPYLSQTLTVAALALPGPSLSLRPRRRQKKAALYQGVRVCSWGCSVPGQEELPIVPSGGNMHVRLGVKLGALAVAGSTALFCSGAGGRTRTGEDQARHRPGGHSGV